MYKYDLKTYLDMECVRNPGHIADIPQLKSNYSWVSVSKIDYFILILLGPEVKQFFKIHSCHQVQIVLLFYQLQTKYLLKSD